MGKKKKLKKQHYVPKLHLKHFAIPHGKKKYYLYYFDKKSEIVGKINVNKAAMENYFYGKDIIGQTIEYSLSKFESNINKIYRDLISSEDPIILEMPRYKNLFAQFVVLQLIRTKNYREEIKTHSKLLKEKIFEGGAEFEDLELGRQFLEIDSDKSVKEMQLSFFREKDVKDLANILYNKKWVLLINNGPIPFWTSDNPIVKFNPFKDPYPNRGLLSKGIQIYFPLSTKLCLCMLDPEIYRSYNLMERISSVNIKSHTMKIDNVNINCIKDVIFINSLQVKECYRQVFSRQREFNLAEGMIKANPSIKDIENTIKIESIKNWKPQSDLIISGNIGHQ